MVQLWRCEQIPSPPNPKSPPRFGGSTNQNPGLVAGEDDPGPAQPGFWDGGLGFWVVPPVCSLCRGGEGARGVGWMHDCCAQRKRARDRRLSSIMG